MWPPFGRASHFSTLLIVILCLLLKPAPVNSRVIKKQVVKIKRSHHYFAFMSLSVNDACKEMASYADSLQPGSFTECAGHAPRKECVPPTLDTVKRCYKDRVMDPGCLRTIYNVSYKLIMNFIAS